MGDEITGLSEWAGSIEKGDKPPAGFTPIPGSKKGGYHKKTANGYQTWYPGGNGGSKHSWRELKKSDPVAHDGEGPVVVGDNTKDYHWVQKTKDGYAHDHNGSDPV